MANAIVIILPLVRIERGDVDLDAQRLLPSMDRRKVVLLQRVREDLAFVRRVQAQRAAPRVDDVCERPCDTEG